MWQITIKWSNGWLSNGNNVLTSALRPSIVPTIPVFIGFCVIIWSLQVFTSLLAFLNCGCKYVRFLELVTKLSKWGNIL